MVKVGIKAQVRRTHAWVRKEWGKVGVKCTIGDKNRKCHQGVVDCVRIGLIIGQGSRFMVHGILVMGQVHSSRVNAFLPR